MSAPLPSMTAKVSRLTAQRRCLVSERAAILQEATGCSWSEADELAYAQEARAQRELSGLT